MKKNLFQIVSLMVFLGIAVSCTSRKDKYNDSAGFTIGFEKFTLENGLTVILHEDRSDPVVAINMTAHVGSSRELYGKTGFAHLFEHLLFNESENLGRGGLDNLSARVGGNGANGSTSRDRTNYFQTVPSDALEKMIWAEADKLGWFINTVTEPVLAKEKQVVKNEKRQGVDNQPYGHTSYITGVNLYPEGHPYSWQVIGSLEDLTSSTLKDVKDFYNRWYVPNNVTLVLAGDFDPDQAKAWVEKYFGEIKRGEEIPAVEKWQVSMDSTKTLYYEDNFARLPELTITWPAVYQYHPDSYALDILVDYLSRGKKAPLYKVLVEEMKLTSGVSMRNYSSEIAGELSLSVTAFNRIDLDDVMNGINKAFADFEINGIPEKDLERIKAGQETSFYRSLSSVMGKANQLAQYSIFAGDPGFATKEIKNILNVSADDVVRVYDTYIKGRNFVSTSFVPAGQAELATEGSEKVILKEENITADVGEGFDVNQVFDYEKTPSEFDRTIEPPYGKTPEITIPVIWKEDLSNGLIVYGIENDEVPLVQFDIDMKGGLLLDNPAKVGVANLMASLMNRGTANRTPSELEDAIEELGASVRISSGDEGIQVSGNCLARNYEELMGLVSEMLLEPRWDEMEFDLIKNSVKSSLQQQKANPNSIARNEFRKLVYGDHIFSYNPMGNEESIASITVDDLKEFYNATLSPSLAKMHVVGAITEKAVIASLKRLNNEWSPKNVTFPEYMMPSAPAESAVYFYDMPGAKQSVFYIGYPCMSVNDPDFYPATVMNYILGGGGFASRLTQELRQAKGYTYGIRSSFSGSEIPGPFSISSSVKTSITLEALALVKDIMANLPLTYNDDDLEVTKSYLIKSNARAFETTSAKLGMLQNISTYGWPYDYVKQREKIVNEMTVERIRELAGRYADPGRMIYLIVGDAETQFDRLKELGYGDPVRLN